MGVCGTPSKGSVALLKRCTTGSGCTRRWVTARRVSSRRSSPPAIFIRCVSQPQGVDTVALIDDENECGRLGVRTVEGYQTDRDGRIYRRWKNTYDAEGRFED